MKGEENESVTSASGEMPTEAVAVVLERFAEELASLRKRELMP